ncbi:MAG: hypothetical protein AABX11_04800 [Nanoarchaeota archaeon]
MRNPFIITKEGKREIKRNKGYLRLLKDLEEVWPLEVREDNIWNEYHCHSNDLESLEKQGFLFETKMHDSEKKQTWKYYKLGIGGFQYLYLRRINFWVIVLGIFASISTILTLISLLK